MTLATVSNVVVTAISAANFTPSPLRSKVLRRLQSGTKPSRPSGHNVAYREFTAVDPRGITLAVCCVVAIVTVTGTAAFESMAVGGAIVQLASAGRFVHANVTCPENPPAGVTLSEYDADAPEATVAVPPPVPPGTICTSVPVPPRLTVCSTVTLLSLIASVPLRTPAALGSNVTAIEQLEPGATVVQLFVCEKSPVIVTL